MESPQGSREKDALSIRKHSGIVTSVIRVEAIETASTAGSGSFSGPMSSPRSELTELPPSRGRATSLHLEPPPSRRGRKGVTVHWPFQSIATDNLSIFTTNPHGGGMGMGGPAGPGPELFRRATWQPPRPAPGDGTDSVTMSLRDSTLIPDYVVNFIRGETPESVARRKQNGGHHASRMVVDITHQHHPQQSHAALFEGDKRPDLMVDYTRGSDELSHGRTDSSSAGSETRHMLPGGARGRRSGGGGGGNGNGGGGGGGGGWSSLTVGWRSGVVLNLVLVLLLLLTGFVCLVVAGFKVAFLVGDMDLFTGSCGQTTALDWGLHALINVAVVVLIVGAHYVFQVLSSPTRSEVARAHEQRTWLEIGVPSARNFAHIARGRACLAVLLLAVAVVTQIIYNSVIFTSSAGMSYNLIAVDASFLTGSPFSNASASNSAGLAREDLQKVQGVALANELANLTVPECVFVFTGAFNADYQNLLLVVGDANTNDQNSLVATARAGLGQSPSSAQDLADTNESNSEILVNGAQVQYCLGQPTTADQKVCTVKLNGALLVVVLVLHLVTLLGTAAALLLLAARLEAPLVTLGDALSSFLRDPDPTTRMNSLLTKENLRTNMGGWGFTDGKYWVPQRDHRWFHSASLTQWLVAGFWWLLMLALVVGLLALTVASSTITSSSSSSVSSDATSTTTPTLSKFGVPSAHTTYLISSTDDNNNNNNNDESSLSAPALAIIASLPQLLLAGLYFSTNALLTAFFLTRESARYAILLSGATRRPLRVSADPQGHQTTSLYLTLPRPISWALAIWFAAMGFVLSQACFVVYLSSPPSSSATSTTTTTTTTKLLGVGFSSTALLILLLMLLVLLATILGAAFACKAPPAIQATGQAIGNPLVFEGGSCSAVMSARCHRIAGETDVWRQPLCWGVVPEMGDAPTSRVTYSARPLIEMDGHHRYV